jgi:hypothetical protein
VVVGGVVVGGVVVGGVTTVTVIVAELVRLLEAPVPTTVYAPAAEGATIDTAAEPEALATAEYEVVAESEIGPVTVTFTVSFEAKPDNDTTTVLPGAGFALSGTTAGGPEYGAAAAIAGTPIDTAIAATTARTRFTTASS